MNDENDKSGDKGAGKEFKRSLDGLFDLLHPSQQRPSSSGDQSEKPENSSEKQDD